MTDSYSVQLVKISTAQKPRTLLKVLMFDTQMEIFM